MGAFSLFVFLGFLAVKNYEKIRRKLEKTRGKENRRPSEYPSTAVLRYRSQKDDSRGRQTGMHAGIWGGGGWQKSAKTKNQPRFTKIPRYARVLCGSFLTQGTPSNNSRCVACVCSNQEILYISIRSQEQERSGAELGKSRSAFGVSSCTLL